MPRKRGTAKDWPRGKGRSSARSVRQAVQERDDVPEIFQEMLAEAAQNPLSRPETNTRASKRRRIDHRSSPGLESEPSAVNTPQPVANNAGDGGNAGIDLSPTHEQIVFDDFGVSDSDTDEDFEDIDLAGEEGSKNLPESAEEPLELDLSKKPGSEHPSSVQRRKPATAVERKIRLDAHNGTSSVC